MLLAGVNAPDGLASGDENALPALNRLVPVPPKAGLPVGDEGEPRVDWRKGLGMPVACGERKEPPVVDEGEEVSGREERREEPKEDDGLKGWTEEPAKPVGWACRGWG